MATDMSHDSCEAGLMKLIRFRTADPDLPSVTDNGALLTDLLAPP